eukprot:SAG31_NODE_3736_length_3944_cov_1.151120_4_plen_132_part_00
MEPPAEGAANDAASGAEHESTKAVAHLCAALEARAEDHGGVPVGVLLLEKQYIAELHDLLHHWKLKFAGVETKACGQTLPPVWSHCPGRGFILVTALQLFYQFLRPFHIFIALCRSPALVRCSTLLPRGTM